MKILLVDDHALIRDALRGVLKELAPEATVLEAADCRQAMHLVEGNPDLHLILLDLNLPDRDGFSVLADLRSHYATISCVVLSASQDRGSIVKAMDLGVLGFIPKSSPREVMVHALRLIFAGGIYIPPEAQVVGASADHLERLCRGVRDGGRNELVRFFGLQRYPSVWGAVIGDQALQR